MAILKNVGLKTSTIDEIKDNFDGAQGVVVVNYIVCLRCNESTSAGGY